jgi:BirA family biotin operon repressor/biotin-[acetyl-CoA-carboxylase] ligase
LPADPPAPPVPPGWRLRVEAELPSTSDLLLRLAAAGEPEGLAVLAHRQTAGRGRDGRAWAGAAGNLFLSVLIRPVAPAREAPLYGLLAAVVLAEALTPELPPGRLRLRWPNDLLLDGGKLAGVLVESAAAGGAIEWLVIGFGANLAVAPAVPGRATSCLPQPVPPESVAPRVLAALDRWRAGLAAEGKGKLLAAWQALGPDPGAQLTIRAGAGQTTGLYRGLDAAGALLLEAEGRLRRFTGGEIAAG